jgi:hypothetical protein
LSLQGIPSFFLPNYGKAGLDLVRGHIGASIVLVSWGFMMAVELATCHVPEDPASPVLAGDTWWPMRCSMSEDLVCHHTDSFVFLFSITA